MSIEASGVYGLVTKCVALRLVQTVKRSPKKPLFVILVASLLLTLLRNRSDGES